MSVTFTSVSFCVVRQEGLGRDALPRPGTRLAMVKPQRALWDISQGPLFLHFSHSLRPSPGQPGGVSGGKARRRGGRPLKAALPRNWVLSHKCIPSLQQVTETAVDVSLPVHGSSSFGFG